MNIIHITRTLNNLTETFIQGFVKEIDDLNNIDLKVFTLEKKKSNVDLRNPVIYFKSSKFSKLKRKIWDLLKVKSNLQQRLCEYGIDRAVYESTQIIFIDYSVNFVNVFSGIDEFEKPIYVFLHGYDASKAFRNVQFRNKFQHLGIKNNVFFVSPCDYFLNRLKVNFAFNSGNLLKLPYGVDIHGHSTVAPASHSEICTLMFIGRFVEKKNPLALIEMLNYLINKKRITNIQLVLIGDGPMFLQVKERVSKYSLEEQVIFKGSMKHELVIEELKNASIYVQHSVTDFDGDQEGLPNSIIEALANGIPVVSTIHSGIPELIKNGYNGFFIEVPDYYAMGDKILDLLADDSLYRALSENAVESVRESLWSNKERANKMLSLVENKYLEPAFSSQ